MAITVDGMARPDWSSDNAGSLLIADLAKSRSGESASFSRSGLS
jgi:hypothetical protein